MSTGEDLAVAGVVALGVTFPWVAAGVAATLLVIGLAAVVLLVQRIRRNRAVRRPRT